jgi:carboxylesterase type B
VSLNGFEATAYSEICPGFGGDDASLYYLGFTAGESCLTINVVRPRGYEAGANLPVGVWIFGGGFAMGGSPDPRYNTTWVIDRSVQMGRPIITVTLNYRVSFFGFPNGQEAVDAGAQNLGLYDQQLALQWIQENIAAFGGDPSKVTIWGQSAGAQSVAYHILGQGGSTGASLFRGGIMESGAASWNPMYTPSQAQPAFDAIVGNSSCAGSNSSTVIDCLRSLPFNEFNASVATSKATWQPNVDGDLFQDYPSKLLAAGKVAPVAIMHGCEL